MVKVPMILCPWDALPKGAGGTLARYLARKGHALDKSAGVALQTVHQWGLRQPWRQSRRTKEKHNANNN